MSDDADRPIVERVDRFVVDRPLLVVVAFLVVTAALAPGIGMITTEAESDQFTEDVEAQQRPVDDEPVDPLDDGLVSVVGHRRRRPASSARPTATGTRSGDSEPSPSLVDSVTSTGSWYTSDICSSPRASVYWKSISTG